MRTCVVVPTYNEADNVLPLVKAVRAMGVGDVHLLFVDDSSPDGTANVIKEAGMSDQSIHLLIRVGRRGIGSAYQEGFKEAVSTLGPDIIVEMDADLQHPPQVIPELMSAVGSGASVAIASRYVPGGGVHGWSSWRRLVSRSANSFARAVLGLTVKDCTSGFRAYSREAASRVAMARLPANGFEFQVAALYLLKGERIVEVPYTFETRRAGKSKLGTVDVLKFVFNVMRIRLG